MATQPNAPFPFANGENPPADQRGYFESLSTQAGSDPTAERAFIQSKIELVRSDPTLSEADKEREIAELQKRLG